MKHGSFYKQGMVNKINAIRAKSVSIPALMGMVYVLQFIATNNKDEIKYKLNVQN